MLATLWNEFILHMFVGAGIAAAAVVLLLRSHRRRPIFRFGPLPWGTWGNWLSWYCFAVAFEFITSFLTSRIYQEFALSMFQAVGFTIGMFLVDRIAMLFLEPESHSISMVDHSMSTPFSDETVPPPVEVSSKPDKGSWFGNRFRSFTSDVVSAPGRLKDTAGEAIDERRQARTARHQAEEAERQADQEQRRSKFRDLIKDK